MISDDGLVLSTRTSAPLGDLAKLSISSDDGLGFLSHEGLMVHFGRELDAPTQVATLAGLMMDRAIEVWV